MTPTQLEKRLGESVQSEDIESQLESIVEDLDADGRNLDSVETILRFMEAHPSIDMGVPGPLVHFVEEFFGQGYEEKLLASLQRRPTTHTVWMLNRMINGTNKPAARKKLIAAMRAAGEHPKADPQAKRDVRMFLADL